MKIDNNVKDVKGVKKFTQSITGVLNFILAISFIYLSSKLFGWLGIIDFVNSLYTTKPWFFWILLVASRALYGWYGIDVLFWYPEKLQELGFFWFKPNRRRSKEESIDRSGEYTSTVVVFVLLTVIAECFICLVNFIWPIYLPI